MAQSKVTPLVIILSLLLAFCPTVTVNAVVDPGQLSIEDDVKAIKEKFQKQMEELRGDFSRQLEGRTQDFENRISQIRAMAAEELDKTRAEARKQMELLQNRAAEELVSIGLQFEKQLEAELGRLLTSGLDGVKRMAHAWLFWNGEDYHVPCFWNGELHVHI